MKDVLIIILIIIVITLSCLPLFKNIQNINYNWDWLQMLSYYRASRVALLEDHQFPLRTYYFSGGYPLLANPQDGSLSPFFLPVLLWGEVVGLKINIFLFHLIGALGMYYLAKSVLGYDRLGAVFSSLVFCLSGHAHRLLIRGQDYIPTSFYFFIPLTLALFIKTREHKRFLIFTVFIFTIIAGQAGLYFAPLFLFIFLYSALDAVRWKDKRIVFDPFYLKNFFLAAGLTLLLGAVKIFPMFELLSHNSRHMDSYNPFWGPLGQALTKAFFVHQKSFPFPGQHWNYFYTGYVPVVLSLVAFFIFWRRNVRYLILLAVFAFLSFSARTPLDLFRFLWQLPLFHSIEAPTRYFVSYVLFLLALTSGSFFLVRLKFKAKYITAVLILLTVIVTADLFITNNTREVSFPVTLPQVEVQKEFFQVKNSKPGDEVSPLIPQKMFQTRSWEWTRPTQYELMRQNIGKINAYVNIHLQEAAVCKYFIDWKEGGGLAPEDFVWHLNPDYKGEVYFLNNPQNKASLTTLTSNAMTAQVSVVGADTLVINQNYDRFWKSAQGILRNHNGLLAVDLKSGGTYPVRLIYRPLSFYAGLAVSLMTLLMMFVYLKAPFF